MNDLDSDEENFISYGTALEPIEEDDVPSKRKFQQPPDQYAVDAHGRRRFHGAFTGGFSAGYGNTVGTPEGWTPATFKSSRAEKAQRSSQSVEDYMDEEDRGEFGIAPRHMQTKSEFSSQKRKHHRYHDGPIPGEPVLEQLLRAVHETAAVKMLKAMGWKPGQGTGDRLTKREKVKAKEQHKVYGCYIPKDMRQNEDNDANSDSSDSDYDVMFAPDDYEPYILQHKSDRFGLGYSGLSRHSVLGNLTGQYGENSSKSHLVMKEKGKKVSIRGQAFGVGAFEADDEDIYATEDMSHYDFELGAAEKKKKQLTKEKGVNVLEGFVKASKPMPPVPSYPPPALPRDYTPVAAGTRRSRFEPAKVPARDQGLGRHELSAEARGTLLGEEPPPKLLDTPTTQANEDPIAKLLGRNVNFVSTNHNVVADSSANQKTVDLTAADESRALDYISIKDTGNEVPNTFKPFKSIPEKQTRYENYLKDKDSYMRRSQGSMDALSEWERNRELSEFEQAAKLYKPLTGIMGDRFTHASEPDDALNPLTAVAKSSTNYGLATPEQIEAAKRGVYGVMTRKEAAWRPESLVCKRFNIPEPGVTRSETKSEAKPKISYSVFSYLESSVHDKDSFTKEQSKFSGSKSLSTPKPLLTEQPPKTNVNIVTNKVDNPTPSTSSETTGFNKRITVAELFLKESEKDMKNKDSVYDTIEKFDKIDLYKAIFLSDSENEDETKNEVAKQPENDFTEKPKNVERNLSPPRGIFANIDFDELNSWKRNTDMNSDKNKKVDNKTIEDKKVVESNAEEDVYGPKIPENLQKRLEERETIINDFKPVFRRKSDKDIQEIDSSSSSDSWVDVKEVKSKKNKKKKKKHKHKKGKNKKKDK